MLSLYDHCMANGNAELLTRWHRERNGELTPSDVSHGSNRKVWWLCEKGHEWQAGVSAMTRYRDGCPVCAGKVVRRGFNDLKTLYPAIAAQWHGEKNGGLTPEEVTPGSNRKVWWLCEKGHEWEAPVKDRTALGSGCPYCANKLILPGINDLASRYPALAKQWDREKNGSLTPEQVAPGSNRKVWWICEEGHGWQALIRSRTGQDSGCPYCTGKKVLPGFNDLATVFPTIANQWHPTLNGGRKPTEVMPGCNEKIWWVCEEGHIWKAAVCSRTRKHNRTGCPVCSGLYHRSTLYRPEETNEPPQGVQTIL